MKRGSHSMDGTQQQQPDGPRSGKRRRKAYSPPTIRDWGSIRELTRGSVGPVADFPGSRPFT